MSSPGGLGQDRLVQGQIRHRAPQPLVLNLKFLQPLKLIAVHPALPFAPSAIGLNRHADLTNRLLNRLSLTLQHLYLPQLQNDVLGLLSLSSHLLVRQKVGSHYPSWCTTSVEAHQVRGYEHRRSRAISNCDTAAEMREKTNKAGQSIIHAVDSSHHDNLPPELWALCQMRTTDEDNAAIGPDAANLKTVLGKVDQRWLRKSEQPG